ncbi:MAG: N-6 DNA methylase [Planctomycetota bacterium]
MQTKRRELFTTVRTEGAILPADLLQRVADGGSGLEGLKPEDFHRAGERLNEVINGSWNRLLGQWQTFQVALAKLPESDPATSVTRERWLLPLFRELDYGRLATVPAIEVNGKSYPVSHGWQKTAIHLVGWRIEMDRRTAGVAGAARTSPHSLVQEFLNQSDDHLWAFLSNGQRLRILRNNISLTRQAFVEFDLEAMMDGEVYADFALLWLLCHQSRVEGDRPEQCWLEKWSRTAQVSGTRALDSLRQGVEDAIKALGRGFLAHPENRTLRDSLYSGNLPAQDYYRQLLRMVYRLLFLFVAEDRNLLLMPGTDEKTRERFARFYSTARLRRLAERHRGTRHCDHFQALLVVMQKLGSGGGCPELGLPALGSFLWSEKAIADLIGCRISNADFLSAIRALAFTVDERVLRAVDYRNLGAEELGSVYESLLELHPKINADAATFELDVATGHERKTTGSYYTPTSLITCLLDSALDPVLEEAAKKPTPKEAETAILALKVCDPACGSGHILIAAAHRIAKRLAAVRTGDEEPAPEAYRQALRDVIGHCIFGVDINPMAVELCKINLWLESLEPGKPLSFLDHHIQCGNSLLGATPALLNKGIPDEAFTPIEGDDKKVCTESKKLNRDERAKQMKLFDYAGAKPWERMGNFAVSLANLETMEDDSLEAVRSKEERYAQLVGSADYLSGRFWADAWCSAFLWKKTKEFDYAITEDVFRRIERNPHDCTPWMRAEIQRLARQYHFLHWHLAFPQVFRVPGQDESPDNDQTGWSGGFDLMLGNPPWEMPEVDDRPFFASRAPQISSEQSAQRRRTLINGLLQSDPDLYQAWQAYLRRYEGERAYFSLSGRYPTAGSGRLNYYKMFLEGAWHAVSPTGQLGMVVPSGLTTNAYERPLWHSLVKPGYVVSVIDFENKSALFPGVHRMAKFSLLVLSREVHVTFHTGCWLHDASETRDLDRIVTLSIDELEQFSPDELALPQFRSRQDLELLRKATREYGQLAAHSDWSYTPRLMFSSSDAVFQPLDANTVAGSRLTCQNRRVTADGDVLVPVYEGKMVGILDHRQADIYVNLKNAARLAQERLIPDAEKSDPNRFAVPQHWLRENAVRDRRYGKRQGDWELVFCDVTSATNERTALACIIPLSGLTRNLPAIYLDNASACDAALLATLLSSCALDFFARLKVSSNHLTQGILASLPIPSRDAIRQFAKQIGDEQWFERRTVELTYTAWDIEPFAKECGFSGPPFRWDVSRRFQLRCEIDAACFHLYGIGREDVEYIMDSFQTLRRRDENEHAVYLTKSSILQIYDDMHDALHTAQHFLTQLSPPPADAAAHQRNTSPQPKGRD